MADYLHIPLDPVTYRDGQRLTAQDLRDDLRHAERRQRLHTRGLHETWGIALGLGVTRIEDDEGPGRMIRIEPGYAVDALGRDILLSAQIDVPIPDLAEPLVLTMRHLEDAAFRGRADLEAVCLGAGLKNPRTERPAFHWRRQSEVEFGTEIPLTQLWPSGGQPDPRVRRYARTRVRPHIAWGETEAGRTGWQFNVHEDSPDFGLYVDVDTTMAGFNDRPFYFAQLSGRSIPLGDDAADKADVGSQDSTHFSNSYGYLSSTEPAGFRFRVSPPPCSEWRRSSSAGAEAAVPPCNPAAEANRLGWRIFWIGIEPMGGCGPTYDLNLVFFFVPFLRPFFTAHPISMG
jgi:hypothetical protein